MTELQSYLSEKAGIDRTNAFEEYLRKTAFEKGTPLFGYFELTPRCNLDCRMCYVHLNPTQMSGQSELTIEQWKSLIDQACDAGMLYATLTGGECLLYPGFFELYEYIQSKGVLVTVLTNGSFLDEKTVSWFSERLPQRVQISVYGSSTEGYRNVTGCGEIFHKVDHVINLMKDAGIPLSLAVTVSKQMVPDFEAILQYCKSKAPVPYNINPFLFPARDETGRACTDYMLSPEEIAEVFKIRIESDGGTAIPWACEEELIANTGTQIGKEASTEGVSCTAGTIKFSISWKGTMTACNVFDFAEAFPLKSGFKAAWNEIHDQATRYQMPVECPDCVYRSTCLHCPALHWLTSGEGKADPLICSTVKKLVLKGFRTLQK